MSAVPRPPPPPYVPPIGTDTVWAAGWTPAEARLAVDNFKRGGTFRYAWQLSIDCTSYPPIKSALEQRVEVPSGLPWTVEGADRAPGRLDREQAERIWREHLERLVDSTLIDVAMLGMSVWHHPLVVDPETLRTDVAPYVIQTVGGPYPVPLGIPLGGVQRWPLSAVGWTAYPIAGVCGYYAIVQGGQRIQLPRPGTTDGEWTVIGTGKGGDMPHLRGAIVSLDMPFTAGMLALRARSNLGVSAGRASPMGFLPPNVKMRTTDDEGRPIRGIAEDAADVLAGLGSEQTAALFPNGMEVRPFELATVGAANYFHTDAIDSMMMVSLAINGHAGALAKLDAQYEPKEGHEEDVAEALIRRDVRAIETAANGLFAMLAALNSGASPENAPKLEGHLPDADESARVKAKQEEQQREAERHAKAHAALYAERSNGFQFLDTPEGQKDLDELFARFGCRAPKIPKGGLPPVTVKLPPVTTTLEPAPDVPAGGMVPQAASPASDPA